MFSYLLMSCGRAELDRITSDPSLFRTSTALGSFEQTWVRMTPSVANRLWQISQKCLFSWFRAAFPACRVLIWAANSSLLENCFQHFVHLLLDDVVVVWPPETAAIASEMAVETGDCGAAAVVVGLVIVVRWAETAPEPCVRMCDWRLESCEKALSHEPTSHLYGLSPVWRRVCCQRCESCVNRFSQKSQAYGRSPEWMRMCWFRCTFLYI